MWACMASETQAVGLSELVASRKEQLQRIKDAGLIEQGRVFLLSLEPIKAEIGLRWPHRSETVWEGVERALSKSLPPPDVFVRLNDTTILVAIASCDSYEGQTRCVAVLRSLLSFFLGRAADADISLSRISGIEGDAVNASPVDIAAPAPPPAPPPAAVQGRAPEDWIPPLTERRTSGLHNFSHYGPLPYVLEVVPVWRLDQETISAYAVRLRLPDQVDRLSDLDQEVLSQLTLGHLLPILEDYRREGATFAVIVPLAFAALSARRPRAALFGRCAAVKDVMRRAVIAEITELNPGIPVGLLRETVAMIKPFVRVVTATVRTTADVGAVYREAAFHGVAVHWKSGPVAGIEAVLKAARRRTPNLVVHEVPGGIAPDILKKFQATHATWIESAIP